MEKTCTQWFIRAGNGYCESVSSSKHKQTHFVVCLLDDFLHELSWVVFFFNPLLDLLDLLEVRPTVLSKYLCVFNTVFKNISSMVIVLEYEYKS